MFSYFFSNKLNFDVFVIKIFYCFCFYARFGQIYKCKYKSLINFLEIFFFFFWSVVLSEPTLLYADSISAWFNQLFSPVFVVFSEPKE